MTVPRRRLPVMAAAIAVLFVAAGVALGTGAVDRLAPHLRPAAIDKPLPSIGWLVAGVLIVAGASLARLRVRVGTSAVDLAWGEASVIVVCSLLPAPWVPLTMLVGVGIAQVLTGWGRRRSLSTVVYPIASLTIAGSVAVIAANAVTTTYTMRITTSVVVALTVGAAGYAVTGAALLTARIVASEGGRFLRVYRQTLRAKLVMVVGNVGVGLFVVTLYVHDPRWLFLLPPALWLLHQIYSHRLRTDSERRVWQSFAEATRELNRLDEQAAIVAGVQGALRLFPAQTAELILTAPDGSSRGFVAESGGEVVPFTPADPLDGPHISSRALMVGGVRVGELRLQLRSAALLSNRDHLMFAAYGDALAAALHDAATHHELRSMTERSSFDAVHDQVTGVANRAGFLNQGDKILRVLGPEVPVGMLLLDLDRFKDVNDALGHAAGDQLLAITAERLRAVLSPGELLARLGGDEFAVLVTALSGAGTPVPATEPVEGAEYPAHLPHVLARARALAEELAVPTEVAGVRVSVEASVGVVTAPAGTVNMIELLRRADIAMYQAKERGSRVAWYDAARDDASTDRLALLAEFREALASRDQLTLLLQPVIELATGEANSVEVLVRWHHPRRGTLEPAVFVPAVEESELVGQFTRHVLDLALDLAARWLAAGIDLPVAVNLSPRSLQDPALPETVSALLARRRVPANRLILEITETVVMTDLPVIDQVLVSLRELGVQLAVDDFGTGYSALTFITRVPVDEVKIDHSFVGTMLESQQAKAIVRATVEIGRALGIRVVAEGVESPEQRRELIELGCAYAQGHHFYRPMDPERAFEVLPELMPERAGPEENKPDLAEGTG